jgi:hypothetical protein
MKTNSTIEIVPRATKCDGTGNGRKLKFTRDEVRRFVAANANRVVCQAFQEVHKELRSWSKKVVQPKPTMLVFSSTTHTFHQVTI